VTNTPYKTFALDPPRIMLAQIYPARFTTCDKYALEAHTSRTRTLGDSRLSIAGNRTTVTCFTRPALFPHYVPRGKCIQHRTLRWWTCRADLDAEDVDQMCETGGSAT
jgi:hypothetical protein